MLTMPLDAPACIGSLTFMTDSRHLEAECATLDTSDRTRELRLLVLSIALAGSRLRKSQSATKEGDFSGLFSVSPDLNPLKSLPESAVTPI